MTAGSRIKAGAGPIWFQAAHCEQRFGDGLFQRRVRFSAEKSDKFIVVKLYRTDPKIAHLSSLPKRPTSGDRVVTTPQGKGRAVWSSTGSGGLGVPPADWFRPRASIPPSKILSPVPVSRDLFALRTDNDLAGLAALRTGLGLGICQVPLAARDPDLYSVSPNLMTFELGSGL